MAEGEKRETTCVFKYIGVSDEDEIKTEKKLKMDLVSRCQWLSGVQAQVSVIKLHDVNDFENYIKGTFGTGEDSKKTKDGIVANIVSV